MKLIIPLVLRRLGFRVTLAANALISSVLVGACATFTPGASLFWMLGILGVGGFFRSLQYTSLNTIAYADLDHQLLSRATSLVAVGQQLSIALLSIDLHTIANHHANRHEQNFPHANILFPMFPS